MVDVVVVVVAVVAVVDVPNNPFLVGWIMVVGGCLSKINRLRLLHRKGNKNVL